MFICFVGSNITFFKSLCVSLGIVVVFKAFSNNVSFFKWLALPPSPLATSIFVRISLVNLFIAHNSSEDFFHTFQALVY